LELKEVFADEPFDWPHILANQVKFRLEVKLLPRCEVVFVLDGIEEYVDHLANLVYRVGHAIKFLRSVENVLHLLEHLVRAVLRLS
jgi:hypothetical protein